MVNFPKSVLEPSQVIDALGFVVDFAKGELLVPACKRKGYRKEAGKVLVSPVMTPRKMAAILGRFRSLLPAMPALRAFTDLLVQFVRRVDEVGWDTPCVVPIELKNQVRTITGLLHSWPGRKFVPSNQQPQKHLASDATLFAWGGLNVQDPRQMVHDFWRFTGHISDKELIAAVNTTQSLAKPNEIVALDVDNATLYSYLTNQGGKVPRLNNLLRPFLIWLTMHRIELRVRLVPSRQMLADPISRWSFDPSEYSVNPLIFRQIQDRFKKFCRPSIDMFASPSNALLPLFCARWPHHQAILTDALACPLETVKVCFAHPPWSLIAQWLHRLRANPHVTSLTLVPWWDSELWWPLLTSLHVKGTPVLRIRPRWGLYLNCQDHYMKKPRWPLICIVLSGSAYSPGISPRFRLSSI